MPKAKITALGCYAPPRVLTNAELEQMVQTSNQWILERTGISERHIADPDVATSDLATCAAMLALEQRGIDAAELDCILVCTVTPDMFFPATACLVQNGLGASGAWGFDLSAACSAFTYAVTTASQMVATGAHDYALVGYILRQTLSAHGTVSRGICDLDGDRLRKIREIKRIDRANGTPVFKDEGGTVQRLDPDATVSMNMWGFTTEIFEQLRELFTEFLARHSSRPDAEFLIPSAVGTLLERNEARVSVLPSAAQWFGITYQQDKAQAAAKIADLIASGDYPPRLWS